ncbi:hypothetical protein IFR05_012330 [Cadophora sp. M221]|nr:hypothetical protein IFR05_012330 [Cadophora sp. M221]
MHLSRTLDQLPKINTVILSKNLKLSSISLDSRAALHQYSISRIWIRKSQWLALLRAIIGQNLRISKLLSEGYWVEKKYALLDNRDFGDDSDVIGSIKYCIPNFESAVYAKEIPPAILASDFELNTDELALTQRVFNNLTHLDLHFFTKDKVGDFDPYLTGCFPTSYWADFPKVLRSLTQITNLSLDFRIERMIDQQCEVYYHHDDLAELFENPPLTLPKLHTLSLSQFRSSGATVKSFLERHNDIQNLKLKYIIELTDLATYWDNPYDPNNRLHLQWIEVLNIMKGHGLMRLDLRGIEGFGIGCNRYGNENENLLLASIHNYVLHAISSLKISQIRSPLSPYLEKWKLIVLFREGYGHNPLLQWKNNMEGQGTSPDWDEELW